MALWRHTGNKRRTAEVLTSLAELADAEGDHLGAKHHLRDSLRLYCDVADPKGAERVVQRLGSLGS